MWTGTVAVALLLTMASAQRLCDLRKFNDHFDVKGIMNGHLYMALIGGDNGPRADQAGFVIETTGQNTMTLTGYYHNVGDADGTCTQKGPQQCNVTDQTFLCEHESNSQAKVPEAWIIANDTNHVAFFTPVEGKPGVVIIFVHDYSSPIQMDQLSSAMRTTMADKCDPKILQAGFYDSVFEHGNFIPSCL